jgi:hypothetical protein
MVKVFNSVDVLSFWRLCVQPVCVSTCYRNMLQERHTLTRRTLHPRRGHIYAVNTQTRSSYQHITHVHVCICMLHAHTLHAIHTFAIRIYVAFMPCTHAAYEPLRCIPRTHAFQPHSCTHPLCLYAAHTRHSCTPHACMPQACTLQTYTLRARMQ